MKVKVGKNFAMHIAELLRDTQSEDDDVAITLKNQRCRIMRNIHEKCHIRYVHRRSDNKLVGILAWHGLQLRVIYNTFMNVWEVRDDNTL